MPDILYKSPVGLLAVDKNNQILFANKRCLEYFSLLNDCVIGCNSIDVFSGIIPHPAILALDCVNSGSRPDSYELLISNTGQQDILIRAERCVKSDVTLFAFTDVTEIKKSYDRISYLATHDVLTSLKNRNSLLTDLPMILDGASRYNSSIALLFIDLDDFKLINDRLGHDAGDHVITRVGEIIKSCLGPSDIGVRFGGDEFIVVMEFDSQEQVDRFAMRLSKQLAKPSTYKNQKIRISASIGISFYPEHGTDPLLLIKCADLAMYYAKFTSKNTYRYYDKTMADRRKETGSRYPLPVKR